MNIQWKNELSKVTHLMHAYYGHGRHGGDPYRGQGRILAVLKEHPEISQKELTELLDLRKQSLAELLAKLEQKEFITREPLESDRRVMNIKLTDKGREKAESVAEERQDKKDVFAELSEADQAVFMRCLEQMRTALEAEVGSDYEKHSGRCQEEGRRYGGGYREARGSRGEYRGTERGHEHNGNRGRHHERKERGGQ